MILKTGGHFWYDKPDRSLAQSESAWIRCKDCPHGLIFIIIHHTLCAQYSILIHSVKSVCYILKNYEALNQVPDIEYNYDYIKKYIKK